MLFLCEKPRASNIALYLTISSFSFCFCTKTHLCPPTGFMSLGVCTIGQEIFHLVSEYSSALLASFHISQSFLFDNLQWILVFDP